MNIYQLTSKLARGEDIANIDSATIVLDFYDETFETILPMLNRTEQNLEVMVNDSTYLGDIIFAVDMAKSICETVLDNELSIKDANWRKNEKEDYKLSAKSSTIHTRNSKGDNAIKQYALAERLLVSLSYNIRTKLEVLRTAIACMKFEIEHGLLDYTIKRKI